MGEENKIHREICEEKIIFLIILLRITDEECILSSWIYVPV